MLFCSERVLALIDLPHLSNSLNQRILFLKPDQYINLIPLKIQKHYINEANLILDNNFKFDRRWDMERCQKIYHLNNLDFEIIKNDDPEWNFMFNRMDWLDYLCLAGILTHDKKYFQKIKECILTWINQHQIIKSMNSTRTLDTGIRLVNWLNCLIYLKWAKAITDVELNKIANNMEKQILYLKDNYLPKYQLSNWGSIQICGILIVLPYIYKDARDCDVHEWAKQELKTQLNLQVLSDGMNWEQSPMYHVELLLALQHLNLFNPTILKQKVLETIKKMSDTLQHIITPNGLLPNFGDSDQVAPSDILAISSYILHDPYLNYNGDFSYENILYIGTNLSEYKTINKKQPKNLNFVGFSSGNIALRNSWKNDANYLFFNNGSMGSGHAHADNLHVSIYGKGNPIFIDSGRYTYREDHPMRVLLKSIKAHNIVQIDNLEIAKPNGSWDYDQYYKVIPTFYNSIDNIHYVEGTVVGYDPLEVWTRKIIMLEEGAWIFSDEVALQGKHQFKQIWHLHPQTEYQGEKIKTKNSNWLFLHGGSEKIQEFPFSEKYNDLQKGTMITLRKPFSNKINFSTILANSNFKVKKIPILQNLDQSVKDEIAEGWKIITPKHEYCISIFHQEIFTGKKIFSLNGIPFHHQIFATIDNTPISLKN